MRGRTLLTLLVSGVAVLVAGLLPSQVYAHGFGERYDLPVPLGLYLGGAGMAVALSFVVIGLFVRGDAGVRGYPRLNLLRWRAGRALVHPVMLVPVKAMAVGLLVLVVLTGLFGDATPDQNLAPTLVWVVWWVGLAYVSALAGNVWTVINPWKTLFEWVEGIHRRLDFGDGLTLGRRYPVGLGVWPGFLLFFTFAWVELVYADSAVPVRIAQMALVYSIITWGGMFLFGKERWLRHGEAFSLAFGFLARFAPTELRVTSTEVCQSCPVECRDRGGQCINCGDCFRRTSREGRELNLRPFAVGLLRNEAVTPATVAFVLLLLATVTFDGFTATPAWARVFNALFDVVPNVTAVGTLGLLLFPALFLGVYLATCALMTVASGNRLSVGDMARAFVFSLVPIALAYHLAHFLAFLLIQGQLIIPLASDPFGFEWDLFGTADFAINIAIVNAKFAWFTAVTAIVLGHIIAVYLAHAIAMRVLGERRSALRSQYAMLLLMVGYTVVSLWILAQPIVETAARE